MMNDPLGVHSDAAAARQRLDELDVHHEAQKALPDLKAQREAVLKGKVETAEAIRAFGPEAIYQEHPDRFPPLPPEATVFDHQHRAAIVEKCRTRQALVERLQALNLSLADIDRQIAAIPPVMARSDLAAHLEDLERRVRASAQGG